MYIPIHRNRSHPFILVIEGVDFSGKTTLALRIQAALMQQAYYVKLLHDPKGSKNAQAIWETILAVQQKGANATTLFFLFLAARHELIVQEALREKVDIVIFDRFIFSTMAYQLPHQRQYWDLFLKMHRTFSCLMPDLCIYCELDFETFQLRSQTRSKQDVFDQMAKSRFDAIQLAYEEAWKLQLCPLLRVNHLASDNITSLIQGIMYYMS